MGGLAWAFTIRKKRDPDTGEEVPVHWDTYTSLLIAKPVRFDFDAVPRGGPERAEVLRRMWDSAREEGEEVVLGTGEGDPTRVVRAGEKEGRGGFADDASESDHDVLINVRESSSEPSESGR